MNTKHDDPAQGSSIDDADDLLFDGREVRKTITPTNINAFPERAKQHNRQMLVYTCMGEIDGLVDLTSPTSGEVFTALQGDFEAIVYDDEGTVKSVAKAPLCYLPSGCHENMVAAWEKWNERTAAEEHPKQPAFALDFYAEPAANPRGYRWMWKNRLRYDGDTDRLSRLRNESNKMRALESRVQPKRVAAG